MVYTSVQFKLLLEFKKIAEKEILDLLIKKSIRIGECMKSYK